ncbi:hypothetical protein ACIBI9_18900 [Nonomuraea sp. NPDC050451]|uniref:hypothetical protein n=1 Tax=Nonomuraea sp. NPDC050451 TaxID=3364364 RepID=UPI0037A86DAC
MRPREDRRSGADAVDRAAGGAGGPHLRRGDVGEGLAVDRRGGVEVDEVADPVGGAVGDASDDHAAVAVADEDHLAQVLVGQGLHQCLPGLPPSVRDERSVMARHLIAQMRVERERALAEGAPTFIRAGTTSPPA